MTAATHPRRHASSRVTCCSLSLSPSPSLNNPLRFSESFFLSFRFLFSRKSSSLRPLPSPALRPSDRADRRRPPPTRVEEHLNREGGKRKRRNRIPRKRCIAEITEAKKRVAPRPMRVAADPQRSTLSAATNSESRKARRTHVFARSYTRRA